ncbi:predicted protein [Nematostella vectensis]|uniref:Integrase catalytic domain-containing protein n=1 Tax=Nematostella vectensis TaxID=45351 RepID=A7T625_NEMVE|nr:predicted protein [Nematostella vectensis]|eukprot:XP_001620684.1 hypothetical protein NEMVEDRAFT_v1g222829 [Nematostella vectensis]
MRNKLPQLDYSAAAIPEVARERDMEYKLKMKDYADKKAADSNIQEGDIVLMRNETKGKLQPNFRPEKYKVINLNGLDMIVQSKENGSTVRRNVQFAKKVQVAEPDTEVEVSEPEPETEHTGPDKANGLIERTNRIIEKILKIATVEKKDLQKEFRKFLVAYRSTLHTSTRCTPFSLMFGREMRNKLPQLDYSAAAIPEVARERDMEYKLKMKDYADKKAADSNIQEGDIVVMRNKTKGKLQPNFRPEKYKVINLNGPDMIVQSKQNGSTVRRNIQFAKKVQVAEPDTEVEVSEPEPETEHTGPDKVTMATETSAPEVRRSVRVRKPPVKFADYLVNH